MSVSGAQRILLVAGLSLALLGGGLVGDLHDHGAATLPGLGGVTSFHADHVRPLDDPHVEPTHEVEIPACAVCLLRLTTRGSQFVSAPPTPLALSGELPPGDPAVPPPAARLRLAAPRGPPSV